MSVQVSASDVKRLREETDAPMMECRAALQEAENDFEKAKQILREKGKAAAAKRADRSTAEGTVALVTSEDNKIAVGLVLECETDFVARNEAFIATAEMIARGYLNQDPGNDPLSVSIDGKTVAVIVEEAIAKIRENIKVAKIVRVESNAGVAGYLHHDKARAAIVKLSGDATNMLEIGRQVAVQAVAFPPEFVSKDQVPQDFIDRELEVETQRAINEGKTPDVAKNIAQGRINKEYLKRVVLLEQPFYKEMGKSVNDFVQESAKSVGGNISIMDFSRLTVGEA